MATYIAYHYGKMNQSFIMKDEKNESLYEANLVKFKLFTASEYEFVNKKTGKTTSRKVGKTKTTESRHGTFNFTSSSYFKLDGENVFDVLGKNGYNFKIVAKLDILHPEFALVDNNGSSIATYKMNVTGEKQESVRAIGNKQKNTVINTESDNLELVFLGAFILGRVDFSTYLI